jgi:hypothetical protein
MLISRAIKLLLLLVSQAGSLYGQTINGIVADADTKYPIQGVEIYNVHASIRLSTDSTGTFVMPAGHDELVEFRKIGYKTARLRIPKGYIPPYFKILLHLGYNPLDNAVAARNEYNFRDDSITYHNLFKHELEFEKLSLVQSIKHPFSALSKRNRQIWQFQDNFDAFQKEKYVDHVFNEKMVAKFTGLTGNNLKRYMILYRPTYEMVKSMSEYSFYSFVRRTANTYRATQVHQSMGN